MKKQLALIAAAVLLVTTVGVLQTSCTAPQQRQTFNTIASIEHGATASVDSYFSLVIAHKVSTNGIPAVTRAYNSLQSAVQVALTINMNNSNALAPANLVAESVGLDNVILQAKGK